MVTGSDPPLESIPKPMIVVSSLSEKIFIDHYYESFLKTFVFNDKECCGDENNYPDEDESVLHYRNYATEMPLHNRINKGYEELDPKRIAYELFGHLKPGDKIAITGRKLLKDSRKNSTDVYKLVHELRDK